MYTYAVNYIYLLTSINNNKLIINIFFNNNYINL